MAGGHQFRPIFVTMKARQIYLILLLFYCSFSRVFVFAQQPAVRIELGSAVVSPGRPYSITVVITGSEQREYDRFPDIKGMSRRGTTTTTSTNTIGNRTEIVQRITQNYIPSQPGTYDIPPFTMTVNGQTVVSPGGSVNVTDAAAREGEPEEEVAEEEDTAPADAKAAAFLSLRSNRNQVFAGEGFSLSLGFFVADDNPLEMDFYALNMQLGAILKQIRPVNCWEENFGIRGQPQVYQTTIRGRKYTEYRLFQAVYFPFNTEPIHFPAVSLKMTVNTPKGKKQQFMTFTSQPLTVTPKPLPSDPRKNQAVIGSYTVREQLRGGVIRTGKSVQYRVTISGVGNLTPVAITTPENDSFFDFYSPSVLQSVTRRRGIVTAEKTFTFQIIPKQAGNFPLSTYFRWIFFNPSTGKYVNWQSAVVLKSTGERVAGASTGDPGGSIFSGIEDLDSSRPFINVQANILSIANAVLTIMALGMLYIFIRGRRG